MMSEMPIIPENLSKEDLDKELIRIGMIAELDAVNFYEQMASLTKDEDLKAVLLEVAREEMVHIAMFETVLMEVDSVYLKVLADYSLARN
ncbi:MULTISPECIES: ferritin family protein [Methanococcoides]|jgi:rubrerythrin|uniref:Rubrerythrin n=2 Tax=Methanococcoides TaxID=2225 RepID=A0A9E5DCU8_9EURY|nr:MULTISPECIES: ferritin family protein [Methanococcoides]MCM1987523.1 rubrerythrin [Methanococcoides seepicolus]MDA0525401.1 rubrerythrin [Methanococcoides alaskense]MDR6221666.1 rubrerythrin [Methanococcoides alaskense]NOQ47867.1 rubrerythrin [Methanococcoides sp.]